MSEPKRLNLYPCGCQIVAIEGVHRVIYCKLHKAAPDLLEACRTAFDFIDGVENFNDEAKEALEELKEAIEKAEGKL